MTTAPELTATELAPAKINLALHVTGRRDDGYHALDSLVVFADVGDRLTCRMTRGAITLSAEGPFADALSSAAPPGSNLIEQAAEALRQAKDCSAGAAIRLVKALPIGSGLGGGSADAAAALRLLNRLWPSAVPHSDLARLAETLGADVPMCLASVPLRATRKGDRIERLAGIPALPIVLVYPDIAVNTGTVFARRRPTYDPPMPPLPERMATPRDMVGWLQKTRNGLEETSVALAPVVGEALAALREGSGCLLARMSGSGSTCFGIFDSIDRAEAAADHLTASRPNWWVVATMTAASS